MTGMDWSGRRALVTGSTGFVGGWLCRRLVERGATVVGLARREPAAGSFLRGLGLERAVELVLGDVADAGAVAAAVRAAGGAGGAEVHAVFHLAGCASPPAAARAPHAAVETSVRGTWNILEAIERHVPGAAVVIASSDSVYGDRGGEPCREEMEPAGRGPYELAKLAAEALGRAAAAARGTRVGIARFANLYGGGDLDFTRLVPGAVRALLAGERPRLRSDGRAVRDYVAVEDAVEALLRLGEALGPGTAAGLPTGVPAGAAAGEAFNFGSERALSVLELVGRVAAAAGRPDLTPDVEPGRADPVPVKRMSAAKARRVLGWTAAVPLDEGLERTVEWYREAGFGGAATAAAGGLLG